MDRKPLFTPWQVAVSEALRDGEAEKAIEAWHLRNRLHLCFDEEKTIARLVDDWERHVRAEPDTSTVVLARTRAETRALSWLMRQRVLAQTPDAKRAVIEVSRDLDGRVTEPLEIAVGDRIRIGATQWEKQLFNGTVVTVEDLEVRLTEGAAVSRKARNRQAGGREAETDTGAPEPEYSVHISARTDDGRRVTFRHDEIRDWHDNIRLDYGYAMTIASAQGLTVDRAFLLVDERPARETIYPAATRHREALDIYVNRSPLAFDIGEHRPEDEAERPVLDSDVRAYLAERWSRSQPKEAALDYVSEGTWRDAGEGIRAGVGNGASRSNGRKHDGPGDGQDQPAEVRAAVNDNALVRIAQEIRHAVNGWRHGAAVDAFAVERQEVMASWDELRARAREEGEAVALSPAFRDTLHRNGTLLKQAASFRSRPKVFECILVERAGIGEREIEELREQHARAGRYLRSVRMKVSQEARQDAPRKEAGLVEAIAAGTSAPSAKTAPEQHALSRPVAAVAPSPSRDTPPSWRNLYKELQQDWNDLVARSEEPDLPLLLVDGYDTLIRRVRAISEHPDLSKGARNVLDELLEYNEDETTARETAEGYLAAAERHVEAYKALELQAGEHGLPVARLDAWPEWREASEMLAATGKAILANDGRYGPYLDAMTIGKARARLTVEQLRSRLLESHTRAPKSEARQNRRDPTPKQEQGFAHILDDREKLRELREKAEQRDRKHGRHQRRNRGLSM